MTNAMAGIYSPDIENLQIAVLATCFYANNKCGAIENSLNLFEQLNDADSFTQLMVGGILTI